MRSNSLLKKCTYPVNLVYGFLVGYLGIQGIASDDRLRGPPLEEPHSGPGVEQLQFTEDRLGLGNLVQEGAQIFGLIFGRQGFAPHAGSETVLRRGGGERWGGQERFYTLPKNRGVGCAFRSGTCPV